ncbi:DUF58 domain-containing protein [Paenibacillus sp. DYY-L-2]|uniref:DUF58 domain-containing protein n=1 Tax=Paenibacillus sp. DYY-L-2 TaxID=3447013 RepID=UPI003F50B64B
MRSGIWTWTAAVLAAGSLGALYGWKGGESLLFLLILLLLILFQGAASVLLGPKHIKAERTWLPLNPKAGDKVTVTLTITVSGGLSPVWLQAEDEWMASPETGKRGQRFPVLPGGKLSFAGRNKTFTGTYTMDETARGTYKGQDVYVTWGDCFGWFKRSFRASVNDLMVIHPAPLSVHPGMSFGSETDAEGRETVRGFPPSGNHPPGRLRAYVPGDPFRHIHWKSSAKKGELLTRIPEHREHPSCCLLLDTDASSYAGNSFELAVRAAATWLEHEIRRSGEACFYTGDSSAIYDTKSAGGKSGEILSGLVGLKEGLDLLAGAALVPVSGVGSNESRAARGRGGAYAPFRDFGTVTIVTGKLGPDIAEIALHPANRGKALTIWVAGSGSVSGPEHSRLAARLQEYGVTVIDLNGYAAEDHASGKGGVKHVIA